VLLSVSALAEARANAMPSPCPNKQVCGSCGWSHIPYEKQIAQKLSDINGSFALKTLDLRCQHILPSPQTEHYRNRMDFVIDFEGRVGLREKGKWWRVIDGHACFLGDPRIDQLFGQVRAWVKTSGLSFFDRKSHEGFLRYAVIRATTRGETLVNLVTSAPLGDEESTLMTLPSVLGGSAHSGTQEPTVVWSINRTVTDVSFGSEVKTLSGNGWIEEQFGETRYRISPNAFFQTNSAGAPLLLQTVREFCNELSGKTLLDLYCGTGFFSVALAPMAKRTIGVELNEEAIRDARTNAQLNRVETDFIAAPTEAYDWSVHAADLVILDPPRSGMHDKALADILRIKPKEIVYISCNPKNFAREMVQLGQVYRVEAMRAIDLFPHTPHVELVTKLRLCSS